MHACVIFVYMYIHIYIYIYIHIYMCVCILYLTIVFICYNSTPHAKQIHKKLIKDSFASL